MHLAEFPITEFDLKNFRKPNRRTPGHPEFNGALGIECTTGPLGQGIAQAVGMALSQKMWRDRLGPDCRELHGRVVCLCGDGCIQTGVGMEALALAGIWALDNLILIYDANGITLDGRSQISSVKDPTALFRALGWEVQSVDGHHLEQTGRALVRARALSHGHPQLILARTVPGKGVPAIEDSHRAHGNPLSVEELRAARKALGWEKPFTVPRAIRDYFLQVDARRKQEWSQWQERWESLLARHGDWAGGAPHQKFSARSFVRKFPFFGESPLATRAAGERVLQALAGEDPRIITGSADVFSSTQVKIHGSALVSSANFSGRNLQFGVREHAMAAVANGLCCDGLFRPILSTFLIFSDYLRPALRLSALSSLPVIHVFTHDSAAAGRDGPTHQPIEMLPELRALPNLDVVRPADGEEVVGAYALALATDDRPTALIFSRQDLPPLAAIDPLRRRRGVLRGGYVAKMEEAPLQFLVLATGSEVALAWEVLRDFPSCRLLSLPCLEVFARQPRAYRDRILPPQVPPDHRLAVEAAGPMSWHRFVPDGNVLAIRNFGENGDLQCPLRQRLQAMTGLP
jgi:transketolase